MSRPRGDQIMATNDEEVTAGGQTPRVKVPSVWDRFRRHKLALSSLVLVVVLGLMAILAPYVAPHDPYHQDLFRAYEPPSEEHWLGLDSVGRDNLSRIIFAARISLSVGVVAALVSTIIGVILGSIAGFYGGVTDNLLSRLADSIISLPSVVVVMTFVFALGPNIYNVMFIVGFLGWPQTFRLIRGQILSLREREFFLAARAVGNTPTGLIGRHLIPNALAPVIVAATLRTATAILLESSLSFLGMGVQPPLASWGNMLSDAQSLTVLAERPWIWIPPGVMISLSVLGFNFVGDGLRDALDPQSQL